jgi:osmotically-inducible protein OsmY
MTLRSSRSAAPRATASAFRWARPVLALALAAGAATQLTGCIALIGGAAVGGTMMYNDRRTSGTQIEDESIEIKGGRRAGEVLGDKGHVNVTSYNRQVLVTGEVPEESDKDAVGKAISGIDNVAKVQNELETGGFTSSITSRGTDATITSKVKLSLIDAKDLQSNAIKVVTEKGVVYLMGLVSEREATRATEVARGVAGVKKVVRVFQVLTDEELAHIQTR